MSKCCESELFSLSKEDISAFVNAKKRVDAAEQNLALARIEYDNARNFYRSVKAETTKIVHHKAMEFISYCMNDKEG